MSRSMLLLAARSGGGRRPVSVANRDEGSGTGDETSSAESRATLWLTEPSPVFARAHTPSLRLRRNQGEGSGDGARTHWCGRGQVLNPINTATVPATRRSPIRFPRREASQLPSLRRKPPRRRARPLGDLATDARTKRKARQRTVPQRHEEPPPPGSRYEPLSST